ncbi:MAG: hypothetical protein CMA40_02875 [Euryarchaeota archaeon]|nr:hypothetical protein [Euryarchaeota archaeon]
MNLEMVGGFNQTNLLISVAMVMILMVISRIRKILNESGTWAAAIMGLVVAIGGHWTWLVTLLAFLSAGFFVTRWRYGEKKEMGFNEGEDGERDWTNVISNGGVPMLISLYAFMTEDWEELLPIFVASVAVATSDTFASEVGCLDKRVYMITTLKKCEPGLNGGFSPNGQIAALVGALLISLVATALGMLVGAEALSSPVEFIVSISIIGFLGCQVDSLLGALLENRGYIGKGTVNTLAIATGAIIACYFHPIIGF